MTCTLWEGILLRQYSNLVEDLQMVFDIPGNTSVTLRYSPPERYVFIPIYSVSGRQPYGELMISAWIDGETLWSNIVSSASLEVLMPSSDFRPVKREMRMDITNLSSSTNTVDFLVGGALIRVEDYGQFVEEITGRKLIRKLEELIEVLKGRR
ncbi:MAG: hypothetical protein DRP12_00035 [Candidatus Aenigmatarchaeota archaeon]|nr:MAG: hypothetical protein DRP12_00035 [Candidatus Aenigmarchaeota archaeon]